MPDSPSVRDVLHAAVGAVGGTERPGQVAMAEAVAESLESGRHLLVQAGTGTGKSLGYLVPSLLHRKRVVVSTATLGLQHQLVQRDLPALVKGAHEVLGTTPSYAVVKGRSNYACLHRVREGVPDDQGTLVDVPEGTLGAEVLELREWAEELATQRGNGDGSHGDRESAPSHTDRAWRQVSVTHRECLGATRCPHAAECFVELAREAASTADVVVTNHALLAIDAIDGVPMLPEYDAVVVDEAHELAARVTQAATADLDPAIVERAARRGRPYTDGETDDLSDAGDALAAALAGVQPGRIDHVVDELHEALARVRDAARACLSAFPREKAEVEGDAARQQAKAGLEEIRLVADRMASLRETEVLWMSDARGPVLHVAPIDVSGSLRDKLFEDAVLAEDEELLADRLQCVADLLEAAGGRTLGLFSSRRAAEAAAEGVRTRLPGREILCQGDAHLSELTRRFAAEEETSLFGTLSLWQGIDLPGDTCRLVVIDRVPFPRPDDPLMSARQRLVEKRGGNGFMSVAASHAALLLAQGAGRLIRRTDDRGVVAILDPRIVTARYGSFLAASLPPLWRTTDRAAVLGALQRLDT